MDKLQTFVVWLDGYLEDAEEGLSSKKTKVVKDKLNKLFEHEAESISLINKPTLQDLGEKHDFPVYEGLPQNNYTPDTTDTTVYRC